MYQLRIENLGQARNVINALQRRFSDLRPFWRRILVPLIISEIVEIFNTEGRGTWPDLDPDYAARKRRERPGKGILRYDDHILEALTSTSAIGNVYVEEPQSMAWGLDPEAFGRWADGAPYPEYHEEGRGVPQRSIFNRVLFGGRFERNVQSLADQWADNQVREVGASR